MLLGDGTAECLADLVVDLHNFVAEQRAGVLHGALYANVRRCRCRPRSSQQQRETRFRPKLLLLLLLLLLSRLSRCCCVAIEGERCQRQPRSEFEEWFALIVTIGSALRSPTKYPIALSISSVSSSACLGKTIVRFLAPRSVSVFRIMMFHSKNRTYRGETHVVVNQRLLLDVCVGVDRDGQLPPSIRLAKQRLA